MDYRKITDTSSSQYQLIHSDVISISDDGYLVDDEGYIGVAIGSAYASIGDRLVLNLNTGNVIKVIVVDQKATKDTYNNAIQKYDGSTIEFVIDTTRFDKNILSIGNLSFIEKFKGNIVEIKKVRIS